MHGFLVDDALWSDVPERLAERGFHTLRAHLAAGRAPHAMKPGADLSPRGIARIVLSFLEELDLIDVVLVGSDTGGAVCQFLLDEDASRIGALVLTNCDAFEMFPPFPFNLLFRLGRHPVPARLVLQAMRPAPLRNSRLGFGWLVERRLAAEETRPWIDAVPHDDGVRRDVTAFARTLAGRGPRRRRHPAAAFDKPVLICWAPEDPFFKIALGRRLAETFPDARLVEFEDALTFVALDQPARLAEEIAAFLG